MAVPIVVWDEDLREGPAQAGRAGSGTGSGAVTGARTGSGRRVVAACAEARQVGIRPFLPLHEALERLPQDKGERIGVIERHDPAEDLRALGRLADGLLIEISPLVAIEPLPVRGTWAGVSRRGAETLLIDITGIGDWFGGESEVLVAARRWLGRFGWTFRMAIADTAAAAWAVTRYGELAVNLLPPGEGDAVIDRLPVRALRIEHEVARQLDRLGIETIGDLHGFPRGGLATRLGPELIRRLDQIRGTCPEALTMHHTEPEDVATCELEYPTTDLEILCHRIERLIDELAGRLAARNRGALRLACRLDLLEGRSPERIVVGLFSPTADRTHWRRLLLTSLEGRAFAAMVQRIELAVDLSGPLREHQTGLFDEFTSGGNGDDWAGRRALARMIETVALRLGTESVLGVELTDYPRPESAYRLRPLAGRASSTGVTKRRPAKVKLGAPKPQAEMAWGPLPSDPLRRPLTLFTTPRRLWVETSAGDGVLTRVRLEPTFDQLHRHRGTARPERIWRVVRCWGPERIETRGAIQGWERRDYYRVEIEDGAWWWLFHQPLPDGKSVWRLHGRFG